MPKRKAPTIYVAIYGSQVVTSADFKIACQRVVDNAYAGYVADMTKRIVYVVSRSHKRAKPVDSVTAAPVLSMADEALAADTLV